MQKSPKKVRT